MPRTGDGLRGAIIFGGLTIGDYYFSQPITRLSEAETQRAQELAKSIKRCKLPWCNNVFVPHNNECAFHLGLTNVAFERKTFVIEDESAPVPKKRKVRTALPKTRRFAPIDIEAHWAEVDKAEAGKKALKGVVRQARSKRQRKVPTEAPRLVERVNLLATPTTRKKRGK